MTLTKPVAVCGGFKIDHVIKYWWRFDVSVMLSWMVSHALRIPLLPLRLYILTLILYWH